MYKICFYLKDNPGTVFRSISLPAADTALKWIAVLNRIFPNIHFWVE